MVWILARQQGAVEKRLLLSFPYTVGRQETCSLVLTDDRSVSRHHAQIILSDSNNNTSFVVVKDVGSKYGTFVNTQQIEAHKDVQLREGDIVRFGVTESAYSVQCELFNVFLACTSPEKCILPKALGEKVNSIDECTHVIVDHDSIDWAILLALARRKTIVRPEFFNKASSGVMPDFDGHLYTLKGVKDALLGYTFKRDSKWAFLDAFGATISDDLNAICVGKQEGALKWVGEIELGQTCIFGEPLKVNKECNNVSEEVNFDESLSSVPLEEPVNTVVFHSKLHSRGRAFLSKEMGEARSMATTALMTSEFASLCRRPPLLSQSPSREQQEHPPGTSQERQLQSTNKFVKNMPLPRSSTQKMATLVTLEQQPRRIAAANQNDTLLGRRNSSIGFGVRERWLTEDSSKPAPAKEAAKKSPEKRRRNEATLRHVNSTTAAIDPPASRKAEPSPKKFKSTFFRSLKK